MSFVAITIIHLFNVLIWNGSASPSVSAPGSGLLKILSKLELTLRREFSPWVGPSGNSPEPHYINYTKIQSTTDQFQFVTDEVNVVIHECIESVLGDKSWDGNKQEQWNNRIMECILEKMCDFKKPYKYIVQCTTVQKTGCVVDVANECYWDQSSDGSCTVRWENPDMLAIVSVFGIFI